MTSYLTLEQIIKMVLRCGLVDGITSRLGREHTHFTPGILTHFIFHNIITLCFYKMNEALVKIREKKKSTEPKHLYGSVCLYIKGCAFNSNLLYFGTTSPVTLNRLVKIGRYHHGKPV